MKTSNMHSGGSQHLLAAAEIFHLLLPQLCFSVKGTHALEHCDYPLFIRSELNSHQARPRNYISIPSGRKPLHLRSHSYTTESQSRVQLRNRKSNGRPRHVLRHHTPLPPCPAAPTTFHPWTCSRQRRSWDQAAHPAY